MFLFYAYGSGLGHLNRILNFIYTTKKPIKKCIILTNSSFTNFLPDQIQLIKKQDSFFSNTNEVTQLIHKIIREHKISELIVDVFPNGFYGELNINTFNIKTILLARILNDSYFESFKKTQKYDLIYFLEKGIEFNKYSLKKNINIELKQRNITNKNINYKKPFFFIIHSSPSEEIELLYKHAKLYRTSNQHIFIQCFIKTNFKIDDNTTILYQKNINAKYLNEAEKIFTGCGFNIFFETKKYRYKQHIIPFKRKYDNQFKRNQSNDC